MPSATCLPLIDSSIRPAPESSSASPPRLADRQVVLVVASISNPSERMRGERCRAVVVLGLKILVAVQDVP